MTRRLYYEDAYTTEFDAEVLAVDPGLDGRHHVVLDVTCFYPTSGGQLHDLGTLGAANVVDVLDEDARIVHVIEGEPPRIGTRVTGVIDADRRCDHREQHTGQHVLSRVIENELGLPTLSSRLGAAGNSLDLRIDSLDDDTLASIEDRTNRVIWEDHAVRVHLLDPVRDRAEGESGGLRQKADRDATKERAGVLRVIEVDGIDRCACGGTHVRHTSEVGLVAITGTERVKGGLRIAFVCGARALRFRRERQRTLDRIARSLTTGHEQVEHTVAKLLEETKERQKRLAAVARELVVGRAAEWVNAAPRSSEGVRVVIRVLDPDEALAAPEALRAIVQHDRTVGVVLMVEGDEAEKGRVAMARSAGLGVDCRAVLDVVLSAIGGRGGGQPDHARGGFPAEAMDALQSGLRAELAG